MRSVAAINHPPALWPISLFTGSAESLSDLTEFFKQVDVVTLENEFIDSNLLIQASQDSGIKVFPEPSRYQLIEDKLSEKRFFSESGTQVAKFFEVNEVSDLIDTPGYLKLAKGGYDGKGTYKVDSLAECGGSIYQNSLSGCSIVRACSRLRKGAVDDCSAQLE